MISVLGKSDDPSRNFWLPYQNYSVYQCVWPGFTTPSGSLPKRRAPAPGNREKALELQPAHRFTSLFKCKLSQQRALKTHILRLIYRRPRPEKDKHAMHLVLNHWQCGYNRQRCLVVNIIKVSTFSSNKQQTPTIGQLKELVTPHQQFGARICTGLPPDKQL